jgi:tRNA threonylcarbamoyladenosine biosynthesis protein TsaE
MELIIKSLDRIDFAAKNFLSNFKSQYFAFYGEMGVGKTTFIKALCKCLGAIDNINSPTFSIVNEYFSKKNGIIYHFDFFRINKIEEV